MSIQLVNVSKAFERFQALKSVNLTIEPGEFVAILGPSGCGKTTLLRLLAGFEQPSEGEIYFDQTAVAKPGFSLPPEKRRIGMVFQAFALWPHLNVTEHVRFPIRHHEQTPPDIRNNEQERVDKVLRMVDLSQYGSRMPHELSGGQKQRVAIARAIAAEPSLLLMDEPLSSLDAMLRLEMRREIQSVHRQTGMAIVYVTHDQSEALAMANRIVVMKDGCIEQVGRPQDIYLHPETEFVARFVSKANIIRGHWHQETFIPMSGKGTAQWKGDRVAECFRMSGLYPLRPDQIQIVSPQHGGIPGVVTNVQFQGKEYHYHIRSEDGQLEVYSPLQFRVNDRVSLNLAAGDQL